MNDPDLDALLRRHRPVGPPAGLRERVLLMPDRRGDWAWLGVAAALLVIVVGSQVATGWEIDTVAAALATGTDTGEQQTLLDLLGDDESARQLALFRLAEQEARRAYAPAPPVDARNGGGQ